MSLDRFVMRGFTGSLGQSTGQWVARSPESQQAQSFQPNNDGGTSFVMGGGTSLSKPTGQNNRSRNVPNYKDRDYEFNSTEVGTSGTTGGRDVPNGCFGRRGGGGSSASSGMDGQKGIMFIFLIIVCIACAVVAFSRPSGDENRPWKKRHIKQQQYEQRAVSSSPVWSR